MKKVKIIDPTLPNYTGHLGQLEFVDGVSVREATEREILRISGCFQIADVETGQQLHFSLTYAQDVLEAEATPIQSYTATEEQFKALQEQAARERIQTPNMENYGALLSEENLNDNAPDGDLVADNDLSQQGSDGGNDFNGSDDDDEEDMSDLLAAELNARTIVPQESEDDEGDEGLSALEEKTETEEKLDGGEQQAPSANTDGQEESKTDAATQPPAAEFVADGSAPTEEAKQEGVKIWTREELEAVADKDGIAGLRVIADPLKVYSKKITALIDGILKVQAG